MRTLRYTLVVDGSSDAVLRSIIDWTISQYRPDLGLLGEIATWSGEGGRALTARVPAAVRLYPCDLLIVHRDAEGASPAQRLAEIVDAVAHLDLPWIPVIPVRMTEAWLLSDEAAIRSAAENARGQVQLNLPKKKSWENIKDPKQILFDALLTASEKSARARKKVNPARQRAQVAARTTDFSGLRGLPSFDMFELEIEKFIKDF